MTSRLNREIVKMTFKKDEYEILNVPHVQSHYNKEELHLKAQVVYNILKIFKYLKDNNQKTFDYDNFKDI